MTIITFCIGPTSLARALHLYMPHDMIHSYDMNPPSTHLPTFFNPIRCLSWHLRFYLSCMLVQDESDHSPHLPSKPFCVINATDPTALSLLLSSIAIHPPHSAITHRCRSTVFLLFKSIINLFSL
jgi:hypothetical protein